MNDCVQITFEDLLNAEDTTEDTPLFALLLAPDEEWYEWSPENEYVCHMSRRDGETICVEVIPRGTRLTEMYLDPNYVIENWRDAFVNHKMQDDITYADLLKLALHGLNIRQFVKQVVVDKTTLPKGLSLDFICKDIEDIARATAIVNEVDHNLKNWMENDRFMEHTDEITPQFLKKHFGWSGHSGPDMADAKYDTSGLELSWHKAQDGSIYPIKMDYKDLADIYNARFTTLRREMQ